MDLFRIAFDISKIRVSSRDSYVIDPHYIDNIIIDKKLHIPEGVDYFSKSYSVNGFDFELDLSRRSPSPYPWAFVDSIKIKSGSNLFGLDVKITSIGKSSSYNCKMSYLMYESEPRFIDMESFLNQYINSNILSKIVQSINNHEITKIGDLSKEYLNDKNVYRMVSKYVKKCFYDNPNEVISAIPDRVKNELISDIIGLVNSEIKLDRSGNHLGPDKYNFSNIDHGQIGHYVNDFFEEESTREAILVPIFERLSSAYIEVVYRFIDDYSSFVHGS